MIKEAVDVVLDEITKSKSIHQTYMQMVVLNADDNSSLQMSI